jgi:hypothetical protein
MTTDESDAQQRPCSYDAQTRPTQAREADLVTPECAYDGDVGCTTLALRVHQEESGYEYASYHPHAENGKQEEGHAELVSLYQPLGEATSIGSSESEQPEGGGDYHDVSGDGCGDGGYCGGHWVRRSEKGHRHGEPIGGSPWEPVRGLCFFVANIPCDIFEKIHETQER